MDMQDIKVAGEAEEPKLSDADLIAFLEHADKDPAAAKAVALLREQGLDLLRELIREAAMKLAALETSATMQAGGAVDVRQLTGFSRQRESASRHRIELAEQLVFAAVINFDNPDWDPLDLSTTTTTTGKNPLLALLCS